MEQWNNGTLERFTVYNLLFTIQDLDFGILKWNTETLEQ
jgi:hypothetical protein